jgi:DNA-binding beta-propeller fold protein YncE
VSGEYPEEFSGPSIGAQIAGYQLEELIGRGGMAVVYRAYDPRLDRRVALKILAPGLAVDYGFRRRFIRESRAAAAVDHPNIIPVFDAGEADNVLFIAMRLVRGGDVRALARAGPVPLPVTADIITQVASALDAAHLHGLVHRDVKPANMLLDRRPDAGRSHVYLADFGLSKRALSQTGGLTSAGEFLGTLDYVAPEQIESRSIDGRADQYALASAAFELLCGSAPFHHVTGLAVAMAKLSEPPPRPADRRSDLPPAADDVIRRAMAIAPSERFPSCGDFAAALREALAGSPGPAARPAAQIAAPAAGDAGPATADAGLAAADPAPTAADAGRPAEDAAPAAENVGPPSGVPLSEAPTAIGGLDREPGATSRTRPPPSRPPSREAGHPPGRPRWRSRRTLSAAAALVIVGAAAGVFVTLHGGGTTNDLALMGIKSPGCNPAPGPASAPVARAASHAVTVGGRPSGLAVTPDGRYSFVTLNGSVAVLKDAGPSAPSQVTTIDTPGAFQRDTITGDGRYVLAAAGSGAYVIGAQAAEDGSSQAVLGTLTSGGKGANNVAVSPDGRFAFVTMADSGDVAVFDLAKSRADGYGRSGLVGMVPVGQLPAAVAVSPDGQWLYVTSFDVGMSPAGYPVASTEQGKLYVLSARSAESRPGRSSVVSSVAAGCGPSGVIVSANGSDVWVTDERSDAVVAFSASRLITDPLGSVIARVGVGASPNSPVFIRDGKEIMVADSDVLSMPGADNLALISTQQALAGRDTRGLVRFVPTGVTPSAVAPEPGHQTVLVVDTGSSQVQAIETGSLP